MKETRGIPKREESSNPRIIPGQKTYLLSKSPLRCYYYAKADRARWSTADRSIQGMRWNAYLLRGRNTPSFAPLEPETLIHEATRTKDIPAEGKRPKAMAIAGEKPKKASAKELNAKEEFVAGPTPKPQDHEVQVRHISAHPAFRHLRIARPSGRPAQVLGLAQRREDHAVSVVPPSAAAPFIQAVSVSVPFMQTEERGQQADLPEPSQAQEQAQNHGRMELQPQIIPFSALSVMNVGSDEKGAYSRASPLRTKRAVSAPEIRPSAFGIAFGLVLRMAENDNSRPWGYDDARAIPAAGALPLVTAELQQSAAPRAGVGYISSARKKVAQLKLASGAASVPQ